VPAADPVGGNPTYGTYYSHGEDGEGDRCKVTDNNPEYEPQEEDYDYMGRERLSYFYVEDWMALSFVLQSMQSYRALV
jgi:hypothetical protein